MFLKPKYSNITISLYFRELKLDCYYSSFKLFLKVHKFKFKAEQGSVFQGNQYIFIYVHFLH